MQFQICPSCVQLQPKQKSCPNCHVELIELTFENHARLLEVHAARSTYTWLDHLQEEQTISQQLAIDLQKKITNLTFFPSASPHVQIDTFPTIAHKEELKPAEKTLVETAEAPVKVIETSLETSEPLTQTSEIPTKAAEAAIDPIQTVAIQAGIPEIFEEIELTSGKESEDLGSLNALAAIDEIDDDPRSKAWIYENIGWFLGATLVITGSLYGVREAWQTLSDVPRHLIVSGALLGYHAGFVGIGAIVARRAQRPGRVLAGIGWLLLPIVFLGLSSLTAANLFFGIGAATVATTIVFFTQNSIAARFQTTSRSRLMQATIPALAAMLPIASWPAGSWPRHLAPLLSLLSVGAVARTSDGWAILAATLSASAVWIFSISYPLAETTTAENAIVSAASALWMMGLAGLLREGLSHESIQQVRPNLTRWLSVLCLAVSTCTVLAAWIGVSKTSPPQIAVTYLITAVGATLISARALQKSHAAAHLLAPTAAIATWLLFRTFFSQTPILWPMGTSLAASVLVITAAHLNRPQLLPWTFAFALISLLQGFLTNGSPSISVMFAMAPLILAMHYAARQAAWLHYAGGIASLFFSLGATDYLALNEQQTEWFVLGFATTYGAAALFLEKSTKEKITQLERLSQFAGLAAVYPALLPLRRPPWIISALPDHWPTPISLLREVFTTQTSIVAAAFFLLLRAHKDKNRLLALCGALALGLTVLRTSLVPKHSWPPHWIGALALGSALIAALIQRFQPPSSQSSDEIQQKKSSVLWPIVTSPIVDGFALASILWTFQGTWLTLHWLSDLSELRRPFFIQGAILLCATSTLWFLTPVLTTWRTQGSFWSLAIVGLLGAQIAAVNRLGIPLPPAQTAWHITIISILLWIASELLSHFGNKIGVRLGKPTQGQSYYLVPTLALLSLSILEVSYALKIGQNFPPALGTTPPPLLLGSTLCWILLSRCTKHGILLNVAIPLLQIGMMLIGAQGTLVGVQFTKVSAPSWQPMAWIDGSLPGISLARLQTGALLGLSSSSLFLALLALISHRTFLGPATEKLFSRKLPSGKLTNVFLFWSTLGTLACAIGAGWQTSTTSALLLLLAGLLVAVSGIPSLGALLSGTATALLFHTEGLAHNHVSAWSGPAITTLGLLTLVGLEIAKDPSTKEIRFSYIFTAVTTALGLSHALTVGATIQGFSVSAIFATLSESSIIDALRTYNPTIVFTQISILLIFAAWQEDRRKQRHNASTLSAAAPPLVGWTLLLAWIPFQLPSSTTQQPNIAFLEISNVVESGLPTLSVGLACLALLTHIITRKIDSKSLRKGASLGRNALQLLILGFASWLINYAASNPPPLSTSAISTIVIAMAIVGGISGHLAWRDQRAGHAYLVQITTVITYGVIRSSSGHAWPLEADAIFTLVLGFILVGTTVLARRANLTPIARATRFFTALLPLGLAWLLEDRGDLERAAGALGSAILYGTLAWIERSQFLGAIGAIAINLALLFTILSTGVDSLEIYLAPLGLLLLALGHLFAPSLGKPLRQWLRILGSLLLYLPAGWSITFQLGLAPDARYPLIFGLVCLLGVAIGTLLRIRAYLLLGSMFLLLDILANLTHAGLRNHRLGFLILSAAGLLILGGMVISTLHSKRVHQILERYRNKLATWE